MFRFDFGGKTVRQSDAPLTGHLNEIVAAKASIWIEISIFDLPVGLYEQTKIILF